MCREPVRVRRSPGPREQATNPSSWKRFRQNCRLTYLWWPSEQSAAPRLTTSFVGSLGRSDNYVGIRRHASHDEMLKMQLFSAITCENVEHRSCSATWRGPLSPRSP